jgi:parallel beta-helix repeat protein
LIVAVVGLFASATAADTIYVDDNNCPGPGEGSELNPYCSIQTAIDNAVDADEIVVAPGTYLEKINFLGKTITVRSSDGPVVTIIDAQQAGSVVTCDSGEGPDTVLEGFTITGGNGTWFNCGGAPCRRGGGMYNFESSPTVTACTFNDNHARKGAGMYNDVSSPTLTNCTFLENVAFDYACFGDPDTPCGFGGGIANDHQSSPLVIGCTFDGNTAYSRGGGMYNSDDSSPTVTNCRFSNNEAKHCGGMRNEDSSPTITSCRFIGNAAVYSSAGLGNSHCPTVTVTSCTFQGNTAGGFGGGMNNGFSDVAVVNCAFIGNTAAQGGGMQNTGYSQTTVTDCTFALNTAPNGRAVSHDSPYQCCPSSLMMANCILWDGGDEIWNNDFSTINITYSDVQGGWSGTGNIDADPLFVDPANGDLRLSPGSPCIDAGDNTAVPDGIDTDLDGNPRFVDDPDTEDTGYSDPPVVDMGAYEFQIPCPWDLSGDGNVDVVDLLVVIASWGPCAGCPADFNGDGFVNVVDLLTLIGHWGPCPGVPCVWDVNGDGVVDQSDLHQVQDNLGPCDGCAEDVNGDGMVDGQDAAAVAAHFGPCP